MDINLLREVVTVAAFLAFLGVVVFAVHPANRKRFDEAARLPLEDDIPSPQPLGDRAHSASSCDLSPGRGSKT